MHTRRRTRTGLVAVSLGFAAIAAGCGGGSSTRATPAGSPAHVSSPTTVATTAPAGTTRPHGPTSTAAKPPASTPASGSTAAKPAPAALSAPSAAQLAAVSQDLDSAGNSLAGSNSAISDSNVNQAETQEGSAP